MRKTVFLILLMAAVLFVPGNPCEAKDVWVAHWDHENADIYVMDETIEPGTTHNGKYFKVKTKEVQDGNLKSIVTWNFLKIGQEMWRYETDKMDGSHTTVVSPGNKIFDFCMKRIGWKYRTEDFWCY